MPLTEILAALDAAPLPGALHEELHRLRPVLVNRYRRRYFLSASGHLRLTLDSDLQFHDARHTDGQLTPLPVPEPRLILELKYSPEHAEEATVATQDVPYRLVRCSKYVLGVEHLPAR